MYKFYFDESYHDRKIVIKEKGINTFSKNLSDSYVGFFWGAKEDVVDEIIAEYLQIEEKHKKILGIEGEFKATSFSLKNYRSGIRTFNKECFNFYSDFFNLMNRNYIVIQYDIISKIEFLIVKIFDLNLQRNRKVIESFKISVQLFIYSLSKFMKVYYNDELIKALYEVENLETAKEFKELLIEQLSTICQTIKGIERKEREYVAFNQLIAIISLLEIDISIEKQFKFSYIPNFEGFTALLRERNIKSKFVDLYIDEEKSTFNVAKNYRLYKVTSLNSKENIGIRIADILSNFVGRFIYAIRNDKNMLEDPVTRLEDLNKNDLSTKRLLSDDWFDVSEEQFKIYYKAAKVFAINHQYYWTLLTGHYYDDAIMFIELMKFFYYTRNYKSFSKHPLKLRKEYFNSQTIRILEHNYTKYSSN